MKESESCYQLENNSFESLRSCHPSNKDNFDFLIRLMRRNVVIPFLGAGFSANFGYPGWTDFLCEQAKTHHLSDAIQELKNREYEKAASILQEQLEGSMEYTLMQAFGDHKYKVQQSIKEIEELPKIFHSLILTTNFDEVVEMLYAKVNHEYINKLTPRSLKDVELSHKRIACGEPTLIKLHGDVATREFVLTEQEYNKIYGKGVLDVRLPLPSFLRDVLLSRVILFLGCSLEGDRTLQVIEQSRIDGSISFALLPLPENTENKDHPWSPYLVDKIDEKEIEKQELVARREFLNKHNIIPIWYPYKKYEALKILLKEIAGQLSSEYKFSITVAHDRLNGLLSDGVKLEDDNNIIQAFYCYANAAEMLKNNMEKYSEKDRLGALEKIKLFYNSNGYAFESIGIVKDIIALTERIHSNDSIELAMCYHDIGYTYERYRYYELMLKAMERSHEILQRYKNKHMEDDAACNVSAYIYLGLAYAYLKNDDENNAKIWYANAETLLNEHEKSLNKSERAFLYNGLYRYYKLLKNYDMAMQMLDIALKLRRELYEESKLNGERVEKILNHIINTHSNKIKIYLEKNQYSKAKDEFNICKTEYPIWDNPEYLRDAKRRILTDHGDILAKERDYKAACEEYKAALNYRKYLHFADDFFSAYLYFRIADSLMNISDEWERAEEAMEYYIQSYVICEKIPNILNLKRQIHESMMKLGEKLSYGEDILKSRLNAQKEMLNYRYDVRRDKQESELIEFFEL